MKAKTFRIITFSVVGFLLAILIAVNVALGIFQSIILDLFSSSSMDNAARAAGEDLALQIQEEGSVLVKNDENTLPLDKVEDQKVSVFGWAATQWIGGGSGSGRVVQDGGSSLKPETDFLTALTEAGIEYYEDLIKMYRDYFDDSDVSDAQGGARRLGTGNNYGSLHLYDYEFSRLYEPAMSEYSESLLAGAEGHSQTAIVVLGRITGESNDAPLVQYKGNKSNAQMKNVDDESRSYLEISTEEEALLEYVTGHFTKVVVLINSTNAMNLGFLDTIAGIDSCLVVGGTGMNAVRGVVNLLYGEKMYETKESVDEDGKTIEVADPLYGQKVSPSGRLTDTYVYDFSTNSSWANTGWYGAGYYSNSSGLYPTQYDNANVGDMNAKTKYQYASYLDYVEDIYVGYKWYETADAEGFWSSDFAKNNFGVSSYNEVVQYPFGFGMSYSSFKWTVKWPSAREITSANVNDEITVTVTVENTGDFPAQEVVELYYTPEYHEGGIEKSAVNLLAFGKTPVAVEPGDTQDIILTFRAGDMGSYDSHEVKINGGGWILEAGKYTLSLRTDAHTLANMDDATIDLTLSGDLKNYDEEQAHNLFTGDDAVDYGISLDGSNSGANITYLSRSKFTTTFPTVAEGTSKTSSTKNRLMTDNVKDINSYEKRHAEAWLQAQGDVAMPTTGAKNDLVLFGYLNNGNVDETRPGTTATEIGLTLGEDYNNELWEDVLDQLTLDEMKQLALHGYIGELGVSSINKGKTGSVDGPAQIGSFNVSNSGVGYPMPTVLAQTWNQELAKSFGYSVGAQALSMGYNGWYAPGVNLHRSAFGGRNYEYYSEDSYLSGMMAAKTVEGSLNAGVYTYTKHIIGYDQETMRDGLACWMTEQALREIYLRPFKIMIDEGGATGLMSSYGRIGAVWSGGSQALITSLLREEWGYNGAIITDYSDHQDFMNGDQMVRAGGDLWMDGYKSDGSFDKQGKGFETSSAAFVSQLREGAHHILYMILNAQYKASVYDPDEDEVKVTKSERKEFPLWTIAGIVDGVVVAGCAVWVVFAILKKDKAEAVETGEPAPVGPDADPKE